MIYVSKLFTSITTVIFIHFSHYQKYEANHFLDCFVSEIGSCRNAVTHKKVHIMKYVQIHLNESLGPDRGTIRKVLLLTKRINPYNLV